MISRRTFHSMAAATVASASGLAPQWASAQAAWPSRPVKLVVPFPPGGSSDIMGRLLAESLAKSLNATFIVENKPGGTTQVGSEYVAMAAPDGYTLLEGASTSFTVLPNQRDLRYSLDSFEVAGGIADYIAVMAVRKTLPVKSVKELVEYGKQNPGKLTYGSAGDLSAGHMFGSRLAYDTGITLLHVPFRGSAAAVNALVAGDIDIVIDGAVTPMVKGDRVRPLATFYRTRHPELPDLPTIEETGFQVILTKARGWGLLAPKGTPAPIMARLSEAMQKALAEPELAKAFLQGNSIASYQSPADYKANIAVDRAMYKQLLDVIAKK
ncbi:MAG: tripartite tricarboxylate transporter substrate binding protein [Burkholderiaceae bacterium]